MEPFVIRRAAPSDAAAMLNYLKQVGGETDNLSFGAEGLPFSVDEEAAYLRAHADSGDQVCLVAACGQTLVGTASVDRLPRRMQHRGEVGISVVRAMWGQGVGSALMRHLIQFAKENHFEMLCLEVRSDNARAIRLYEKFGFQKRCRYPDFCRVNGEAVDCDLMSLRLNAAR